MTSQNHFDFYWPLDLTLVMWDLALMQSTSKVLLVAYSNQGRAIYFRGKIGMQRCSKYIKPRSNKQANMCQ